MWTFLRRFLPSTREPFPFSPSGKRYQAPLHREILCIYLSYRLIGKEFCSRTSCPMLYPPFFHKLTYLFFSRASCAALAVYLLCMRLCLKKSGQPPKAAAALINIRIFLLYAVSYPFYLFTCIRSVRDKDLVAYICRNIEGIRICH